jgi:hypothetical protein
MVSKNQNKIIKNRNGMYFFYDKNNVIKIGIKSLYPGSGSSYVKSVGILLRGIFTKIPKKKSLKI